MNVPVIDPGQCGRPCPGGRRCACNGRRHVHHICGDSSCLCHRPEAYGLERVVRRGYAHYVPHGETLNATLGRTDGLGGAKGAK